MMPVNYERFGKLSMPMYSHWTIQQFPCIRLNHNKTRQSNMLYCTVVIIILYYELKTARLTKLLLRV